MSLWKYNDVELEINLGNIKFQKKYESAFKTMEQEEKALQQSGSISDFAKKYCLMFMHLFDNIFGEGTSDKLFRDEMDIELVDDCYGSFINACRASASEIIKRQSALGKKYSPKQGMKLL